MKSKVIIVEECKKCPYRDYGNGSYKCGYEYETTGKGYKEMKVLTTQIYENHRYKYINNFPDKFPVWCPLTR